MEEINHQTDVKPYAKQTRILFSVSRAFLFGVILILPAVANAASLYFSPASGSYAAGKTFNAGVYVSSAEQAMNAASGVISFPSDKLEVISLSKSGSIFSLWVLEPTFSNGSGVINFEGIVLNPGFSGSGGKIMTINFKVKSAGQASLNFSSGSILANDGAGTNILGGLGSANYQLSSGAASPTTPTEPITATTPTATAGIPAAPRVISSTHHESDKWYNNNKPQFSWTLPAGVTGVGFYFSQSPTSNPGPVPDGLLTNKSYENLADGIWYFHLKFKNSFGWGPIAHYKIQIDTTPPQPITIRFIDGRVVEQPRIKIIFDTVDAVSGIDYYKIKISDDILLNIPSIDIVPHNPFTLPPQSPGNHSLEVTAFDRAGNTATATEEFIIRPALPPQIIEFPQQLKDNENLEIKGETVYPNARVVLSIQQDDKEPNTYQIITDQNGKFTYISKKTLPGGLYKIWAYVTDEKGTQSNPSEKISIKVESSAIFRAGTWVISFLSVVIPLIALFVLLIFMLLYTRHKFSLLKKQLRKEVREARSTLHQAFDLLKEDMQKQIKILEKARTKRQLTEEEEKIIKRLKRNLDDAEKLIKKEIEDIEKEVR